MTHKLSDYFWKNTYIFFIFCFICLSTALGTLPETPQIALEGADYILCLDGGGSKTAIRLATKEGQWLFLRQSAQDWQNTVRLGPTNINTIGKTGIQKWLKELLALEIAPSPASIDVNPLYLADVVSQTAVIAGIAGEKAGSIDNPLVSLFLSAGFQEKHLLLENDAQLALRLTDGFGAILIAGTGSVCLGRADGKDYREGGLGWALGDEGSGYGIGKEALKTAFEQSLGIRPETPLKHAVEKFMKKDLDVSDYGALLFSYASGTIKPNVVAQLTPIVMRLARDGDPAAKSIIEKAASDLAIQLSNVIQKVLDNTIPLPTTPFKIFFIGSLFKPNIELDYRALVVENPQILRLKSKLPLEFHFETLETMPAEILVKSILEKPVLIK